MLLVVVRVVWSGGGEGLVERCWWGQTGAGGKCDTDLRQRQHRFHPGCVRFIEPIYRLLFGVGRQSAKCIDVSYTD